MIDISGFYKKNKFSLRKKGFTVMELLIVVAAISILSAIVLPSFGTLRRNQIFKSTVNEVNSLVQKARNNATSSIDSSSYGVHFESGQVVLFKGNTYGAPGTTLETISLQSLVTISGINFTGGVSDIVFAKGTGLPNVSGEISITSSTDVRTISINGAGSISVYVPSVSFNTLGVSLVGNGTVTSSPSGINCGATCSYDFNSLLSVSLLPNASSGYVFSGWSGGGCTGSSTCVVNMSADKNVIATFVTTPTYDLNITVVGTGGVTSSPGFINCNPTCSDSFVLGASVVLTATPSSGYVFSGWSGGGCTGTGTCNISMTSSRNVTGTFVTVPTYKLVVNNNYPDNPVRSSPSGIDCGNDCVEFYNSGTVVTLEPNTKVGYTFIGWSGDCSGTADCVLTMNAIKDVTANFVVQETGYTLTVDVGAGGGTVGSNVGHISCNPDCLDYFDEGEIVSLSAKPEGGYAFVGWGEDCSENGSSPECSFRMEADMYVTAYFEEAWEEM